MGRLCAKDDFVAVASGDKTYVFTVQDGEHSTLELISATQKADGPAKIKDREQTNVFLGIQFSPCGKWLAAFTSRKQLLIWETETWKLLSERTISKTACSLAFTHDGKNIVLVDKSGEAFLFSVEQVSHTGQMILGHLSMLLDVVMSADDKYIITCDRDEKIRVSHFPNSYNISAYCLGHKEFVSSICLLPHNPSILISSSGDGTVQLWNYLEGRCLKAFSCLSDAEQKMNINHLNVEINGDKLTNFPVKKVQCGFIDSSCSALCILLHGTPGCLIYCLNGISFEFLNALCEDKELIDFTFANCGDLWVYSLDMKRPVECFSFDKENKIFVPSKLYETVTASVATVSTLSKSENSEAEIKAFIPQLFKRKFDNIKDYYDQKKARVGD